MEVGAKLKNDIELKGHVAEEIQMIIVSAVANTTAKAAWGGERVCFSSVYNPSMGKSGYEQAQSLEGADPWFASCGLHPASV